MAKNKISYTQNYLQPSHKVITDLKTQLAKYRSKQFSKYLITLTKKKIKTTKILINHRDNTLSLERSHKSLAISDLEKANLSW